jgi:regulator of Ty1 transposition protein 103
LPDLDKTRGSGKKSLLGGSSLSSSSPAAPTELQPLIPLHQAVTKALSAVAGAGDPRADFESLMNSSTPPPSAPVHAARLSGLLKKLASAEGAVSESIKARRDLINGLEKLLETNREAITKEEAQHQDLISKKDAVEAKKRDVEDEILRRLPSESPFSSGTHNNGAEPYGNGDNHSMEPPRPQMEELTPPPMESLTPMGSPGNDYIPPDADVDSNGNAHGGFRAGTPTPPAGFDFPAPADYPEQDSGEQASKKRKLDGGFGGFMGGNSLGIAEDVDDLIRSEGGGY